MHQEFLLHLHMTNIRNGCSVSKNIIFYLLAHLIKLSRSMNIARAKGSFDLENCHLLMHVHLYLLT